MTTLSPDQFAALAQLLRLRQGVATEAARLALVEGLSVPDAARKAGLHYPLAYKAIRRAQEGLDLAVIATSPL